MADENVKRYAHLLLPRAEVELERRQRRGFSVVSPKPFAEHGSQINTQVGSALQQFQSRAQRRPPGIDPKLLLRIRLERAGAIPDDEWRKNGLILVSEERDGVTVLLAGEPELLAFQHRLRDYQHGPRPQKKTSAKQEILPEGMKFPDLLKDKIQYDADKKQLIFEGVMSQEEKDELLKLSPDDRYQKAVEALFQNSQKPPYASLFDAILKVREYGPEDRKGKLLQEATLESTKEYALDLELWHPGDTNVARQSLSQVETFISQQGGRVVDRYIGTSVCLARVIVQGNIIDQLLQLEPVAKLDLPPRPTLTVAEVSRLTLEDFPPITRPPSEAPRVCVLDSGIATGHPMLSPAVGDSISVPSSLGSSIDEHGHGTQVAGLALYNDISECIRTRQFSPSLWVMSAKVTKMEDGPFGREIRFPDEKLISTQMREAIEYFYREHECRVFNISLGDDRLVYDGGKPSIWAWTLDDIARELDVIIIVSSGNSPVLQTDDPKDNLDGYPKYLLCAENRIVEPSTAAIPLTVGSLAHSEAPRGAGGRDDIALRAVAQKDMPSPFTRIGPGIGGAVKPELCEYGGNLVFDHRLNRLQDKNLEVEIVSFCHDYATGRLFAWDKGTSLAAPKVTHYAAQLLSIFPRSSVNLVRALLVSSASIPEVAKEVLSVSGNDEYLKVCGYGKPNFNVAAYSFDNRVTLFAENELLGDRFHVYEIPLPDIFRHTRGKRSITVTLAFDPPTRHTRKDYLGFTMKFWLVRGKTLKEVERIFVKTKPREETVQGISGARFECDLKPGHRIRERGTLQKGIFSMSRNPDETYGDTYYLVVQCVRNWSYEEKQRYAVVVALEHLSLEATLFERVSLYQAVQEQIEARERILIRH
ncbi:MAG: S8 family peptidase [Desulfobacterales bacterium]|nr:S8 family peptidase [Desulfobacterales bacterium]